MRGVNKVILLGRLGSDPEIRKSETMRTKANIRLATSETYKGQDGNWVEVTDWHTVVMWGPMADRAEKELKKGTIIYVEGKLKTRSWEDQNGIKRYATEVLADIYQSMPKTEEAINKTTSSHSDAGSQDKPTQHFEDDLPF